MRLHLAHLRLLFAFALLTLGLTQLHTPAQAADQVVGDGTPGSCTEQALRDAVAAVVDTLGGTLTFNCGDAPHTILLTKQLKFINKNASTNTKVAYVIDGGGRITLDGGDQTRVLYTASGVNIGLTVRNLTIINGNAAFDPDGERAANQGGGIYSGFRNTLTVENVRFENNRARGERHPYHGGGAIAVDTTSVVVIRDSVFIGNRSPNGGAINNLLSRLTIERSEFRENRSTRADPGGGGAIYNDAGKLTIIDSLIIGNSAANLGGGIFTWANLSVPSIKDYLGKTVIRRTVIADNDANHGGGLWKGGSFILEMFESSVTNNRAVKVGGGMSATGPGPNFKIVNSTIAFNVVQQTGSGAGIFSANAKSTVKNSTIAYNTVPNDSSSVGAGIHASDITLTNTVVAYNTGGWNNEWSCMGTIRNGGQNLQFPGKTCGGIPSRDAKLAASLTPALPNVTIGTTQTLALLSGSPALNKAKDCPGKDQRGVIRPQGDGCDIGAWELEGTAPGVPVITAPTAGQVYTGDEAVPTFTWDTAAGATRYRLLLKDAKGKTVMNRTGDAAEFGCAPGCAFDLATASKTLSNQAYTLTIEAINDLGKRAAKVSFRAQFPGKAALTSPAPDGTTPATATFVWAAVEGAADYRVSVNHLASKTTKNVAWTSAETLCADGVCTLTLGTADKLKTGPSRWRVAARNAHGTSVTAWRKVTITKAS